MILVGNTVERAYIIGLSSDTTKKANTNKRENNELSLKHRYGLSNVNAAKIKRIMKKF